MLTIDPLRLKRGRPALATKSKWALAPLVGYAFGWSTVVAASGLQVQPVSVTFTERSDTVFLSNTGPSNLQAQVRVYRWTQDADGDQLELTNAVVASPPMAAIAPNERHLVRLVRMDQNATGNPQCETAYRLKVDEVPALNRRATEGLRYVMSFSVPVFVKSPDCAEISPDLRIELRETPLGLKLRVLNSGRQHAQLARITFTPASGAAPYTVTQGLFGYVLAEGQRDFALPASLHHFADGGTLKAQVNGSPAVFEIPPARPDLG